MRTVIITQHFEPRSGDILKMGKRKYFVIGKKNIFMHIAQKQKN